MIGINDMTPSPSLDELLSAFKGAQKNLVELTTKQAAIQDGYILAKKELEDTNTALTACVEDVKKLAGMLTTSLQSFGDKL